MLPTQQVFVGKRVGDMNQERSIRKVGKVAQQATAVFADAEIIEECR
jgi:hypothetical protein